mgnify:CR=1 FL=1
MNIPTPLKNTAILLFAALLIAAFVFINNPSFFKASIIYIVLAIIVLAFLFFFRPSSFFAPDATRAHAFQGLLFGGGFFFFNKLFPAFTLANPVSTSAGLDVLTPLLILGVFAPVFEEAFFRLFALTFLQSLAFGRTLPFILANALQAVLFAVFHAFVYGLAFQRTGLFVGAFLFGFLAGVIAYVTKSLTPGIIAHSFVNLTIFAAQQVTV